MENLKLILLIFCPIVGTIFTILTGIVVWFFKNKVISLETANYNMQIEINEIQKEVNEFRINYLDRFTLVTEVVNKGHFKILEKISDLTIKIEQK